MTKLSAGPISRSVFLSCGILSNPLQRTVRSITSQQSPGDREGSGQKPCEADLN